MTGSASEKAWERFQWSLRALVQPGEAQIALFPEFVVVADELALDFDREMRAASDTEAFGRIPEAAARAIAQLDGLLASMSGRGHADEWTDEALIHGAAWRIIRARARDVLEAMKWPDEPPPRNRAVYVRGR